MDCTHHLIRDNPPRFPPPPSPFRTHPVSCTTSRWLSHPHCFKMKVIPKTSRPFFNDIRFCAATIYIERFRILDSNGTSMFAIKKACNHANRYVPIRGVVCLHVQVPSRNVRRFHFRITYCCYANKYCFLRSKSQKKVEIFGRCRVCFAISPYVGNNSRLPWIHRKKITSKKMHINSMKACRKGVFMETRSKSKGAKRKSEAVIRAASSRRVIVGRGNLLWLNVALASRFWSLWRGKQLAAKYFAVSVVKGVLPIFFEFPAAHFWDFFSRICPTGSFGNRTRCWYTVIFLKYSGDRSTCHSQVRGDLDDVYLCYIGFLRRFLICLMQVKLILMRRKLLVCAPLKAGLVATDVLSGVFY